jgi:hypothetical protein
VSGKAAWIGLTDDQSENTFAWEAPDTVSTASVGASASTGRYAKWPASGEPNNSGGVEDYAHYISSAEWNDNNANAAMRYSVLEAEPTFTKKVFDVNYSVTGNTGTTNKSTRVQTGFGREMLSSSRAKR